MFCSPDEGGSNMESSHGTGGSGGGRQSMPASTGAGQGMGGGTMTLEEFDAAIRQFEAEDDTRGLEASINPQQLCDMYQQLKPVLMSILPILARFSPPAASVIRRLMVILDGLCAPEPAT